MTVTWWSGRIEDDQVQVEMKSVAYLLGAGVTQAETSFGGFDLRLLTSAITEGIHARLTEEAEPTRGLVSNDLSIPNVDVEQLISLYESTGTSKDSKAAQFLRESFMEEVLARLKNVDKEKIFQPPILSALLEMHARYGQEVKERLSGILTLNYDNFAERALKAVFTDFSFGFTIGPNESRPDAAEKEHVPLLLKLHGSFDWLNEFPPRIVNVEKIRVGECLWIPPGVEKKKQNYPFNILWGKAKEVLDCDILRVIGCSLSRNDWELITLLHLSKRSRQLSIEYINFENLGRTKSVEFPYLGIVPIMSVEGFRSYLSNVTSLKSTSRELDEFASDQNHSQFNCLLEWIKFRKTTLQQSLETVGKNLDESKFLNNM